MEDDLFSDKYLEDHVCSYCGASRSVSMGHGRYACQKCHDSWWCPECGYSIHKNHKCPTLAQQEQMKLDSEISNFQFGVGDWSLNQYIEQRNSKELDILYKALMFAAEQVKSKKESIK